VSNEQITNISGAVAVQGSDTPVTPASFDTTSGGDGGGGNSQGGNSQGGNSQGGNSQGGNSQGGNSQGGNSQGGDSQGNNKTYTVTFNANGGTGTVPAAITVNAGSSTALPSGTPLSKTGYTFGGWNTKADGTGTNTAAGASYTVTASVTLYAKWDAAVSAAYTITFNANGGTGTVPAAITVNASSSAALPSGDSLSKTGYTFGGWNTKADGTGTNTAAGASYTVTASVTLYAKWDAAVPDAYTITFNANGGTGTVPAAITINAGSSAALPSGDSLAKSGYDFGGWNTKADGTGTNTTAGASYTVTASITLYAKWNNHVHNYGDWVVTTAPTVTQDGVETRTCTSDSTHKETRPLYATGTPGLQFTLFNGNAYYVKKGTVTSGAVFIPAYWRGNSTRYDDYLPVTEIGNAHENLADGSFTNTDVSSVTIPSTVTAIARGAFSNCKSLTNVNFPSSLTSIKEYAFYGTALTSITIPSSVTYIGEFAFYGTGLTSVTIPSSVTSIGTYAFAACENLTSVTISPGVTSIGDYAFGGSGLTSVDIPSSVTSIGQGAFMKCADLVSVTIPSSVTSIGEDAFVQTGLISVTIPSSVTSIGYSAFGSCYNLVSVTLTPGLKIIGGLMFNACTGITSITIPTSVTSVGGYAFSMWTPSQTINIQGHASRESADAAWPEWHSNCNAIINYQG